MLRPPTVENKNTAPLVSFLIPTFNRGYCIHETLDSILSQSGVNVEAIVLDDGSTDNTEALFSGINDGRVRYYRFEENRGHPVIMKFGIEKMRGDYGVFMGSDDVLASDAVAREAVDLLEAASPDVWTVTYAIRCAGRDVADLDFPGEILDLSGYLGHPKLLFADFLHIYRRPFLDAFLQTYTEPYRFFTSFLDVYYEYNCRQIVVDKIGAVAGFYGDNVTKGTGGARYELWAEEATLHHFFRFRTYPPAKGTRWWREKVIKTMFWSVSGRSMTGMRRWNVAAAAAKEYIRTFGLDARCLAVLGIGLLPCAIPRYARLWRDRRRRYRQ